MRDRFSYPRTLAGICIAALVAATDAQDRLSVARCVSHGGHWRGVKADLSAYCENDVVVVILTNDGDDDEVNQARDDFERRMRAAYR